MIVWHQREVDKLLQVDFFELITSRQLNVVCSHHLVDFTWLKVNHLFVFVITISCAVVRNLVVASQLVVSLHREANTTVVVVFYVLWKVCTQSLKFSKIKVHFSSSHIHVVQWVRIGVLNNLLAQCRYCKCAASTTYFFAISREWIVSLSSLIHGKVVVSTIVEVLSISLINVTIKNYRKTLVTYPWFAEATPCLEVALLVTDYNILDAIWQLVECTSIDKALNNLRVQVVLVVDEADTWVERANQEVCNIFAKTWRGETVTGAIHSVVVATISLSSLAEVEVIAHIIDIASR